MGDDAQADETTSNGNVTMTKSELDDYIDDRAEQRAEAKFEEMRESGEAPSVQRGEAEFTRFAQSLAKAMDFERGHEDDVLEDIDKSAHRVRNNPSDYTGLKAFSGEQVGGQGKYAHQQPMTKSARRAPHRQSFKDRKAVGTGYLAAKWMWYSAKADRNARHAKDLDAIEKMATQNGDKQIAQVCQTTKNLESGDFGEGGSLIPTPVAEDFIDFLHGQTAFRDLDPMEVSLDNGSLTFPRIDSAVTVNWRGEGTTSNSSTPGTGEVKLDERFLQIFVILTNEMIRHANQGVMEFLREHMRKEASAEEDRAFLRGTGSGSEPEGLRNLVVSANQDIDRQQSSSESDAAEILGDHMKLQDQVYGSNGEVKRERPGYIYQARTAFGLQALTDADNNPTFFADQLAGDTILGADFAITTQLPENLDVDSTSNTDHTELYFAEFSEVMVGDGVDMDIEATTEATVLDSSGSAYRTFAKNSRALRLEHATDLALMHSEAAANLKNVDWGADILS